MAASAHNSPIGDMLAYGHSITQQQDARNNNNINNGGSKGNGGNKPQPPEAEKSLKCPRCDSINTKFCYYNNYSLSQPRYFCKSCRRYWTKGGTLRNVPVGGGCRRKTKRPSSSSSSVSSISSTTSSSSPLKRQIPLSHDLHHFSSPSANTTTTIPFFSSLSLDHDLSFLGSLGLNGVISNPNADHSSMINSYTPSFFDYKSSFYHGLDDGTREIAGVVCDHDQITSGTVSKREITMPGFENESRVLLGFPWNGNSEELLVDSAERPWNGISSGTSNNWQGLLNSPLMM